MIKFFYLCLDGFSLLGKLFFDINVMNLHFFPICWQNVIDVNFLEGMILRNVWLLDLTVIHFIHHFDRCWLDFISKRFKMFFNLKSQFLMLLHERRFRWLIVMEIQILLWEGEYIFYSLNYFRKNDTSLSWSNWEILKP